MSGNSENKTATEDNKPTDMSNTDMSNNDKTANSPGPVLDTSGDDEKTRLEALGAAVRDQDALESNINRQADELLVARENDRDRKRLGRAEREKSQLELQIRRLNQRIGNAMGVSSSTSLRLVTELSNYEEQLRVAKADIEQISNRIQERQTGLDGGADPSGGTERLPSETRREFLIRTGKITPFSKTGAGPSGGAADGGLQSVLEKPGSDAEDDVNEQQAASGEFKSHRDLARPGFARSSEEPSSTEGSDGKKSVKRRRLVRRKRVRAAEASEDDEASEVTVSSGREAEEGESPVEAAVTATDSDDDDEYALDATPKRKRDSEYAAKRKKEDLRAVDDGNEKLYQKRLQDWVRRRSAARRRIQEQTGAGESDDQVEEWYLPHPTVADKEFGDGFRIPGDVFKALFDYQKVGVQWLWELYSQRVGGIVGDEMGLGKTIQAIAFVAGLHRSKMLDKPVIIAAPATLLKQWVKEFHKWWPALRVSILHASGSGMMDVRREERDEEDLLIRAPGKGRSASSQQSRAAQKIVDRVVKDGHVLVTTYSGLQMYSDILIPVQWGYCILDEGHTIRNPNTSITIHCKELRTPNRIILSGTPMQNNLTELWSLFDFVFPMRLGNLLDFKNSFEIPIKQGGYANASNQQVQIANKCAEALKDAISPYLLQRNKVDVAADLPKKTERVLFCRLTKDQRDAYQAYLNSGDVASIMNGRRQVLAGIDILRKICNHPDLQDHKTLSVKPGYQYGKGNRSGKMIVVRELLNVWKKAGHKTLLFSQHRIMLDILEDFVRKMGNIAYRRMDGTTPITARQTMIDEFNNNDDIDLFLLTTKVGGLGTNLTSSNRVIIFDPDWNPSTDIQARERSWRLGQKREVEIYRLMTAGTIEEKIFHRQIFKQFLSNKVLKDPKQRQSFQMQDLHDLFTLGDPGEIESETGKLFKGTETRYDDGSASAATPATQARNGKGKAPAPAAENLRTIHGIRSMEEVDASDEGDSGAAAATSPTGEGGDVRNSETRIMSALFARSGVTSTIEHDQIINGKRKIAADPKMVQREAERVAAAAAAQLRRNATLARGVQAGAVTWTGEFGTMGRPQDVAARAGPASSSLLQNLKDAANKRASEAAAAIKRTKLNSPQGSRAGTPGAAAAAAAAETSVTRLLLELRDFMLAHGGEVRVKMIMDHFNHKMRNEEKRKQEFYAVIREIAEITGGRGERTVWRLKDEFRSK